jgi:glyoxylase-like metal-dependent hydrolase (beta-lactamase superfamily II)
MCPRGARLLSGRGGLLEKNRMVAHCLLVEAGGEHVLVDTGFGTAECANPKRLPAAFLVIAPQLREDETALRQLEALGLNPGDVRHIVATHLDPDHAGGLRDFPDAHVHVFGAELAAAQAPPLRDRIRYLKEQWSHGPRWVEYGAGGDSWFGFESVRVIRGLDAEIALIPLPGHTIGHCGVAIKTGDGWLLHCGDAFFHHGDIDTPRRCPPGMRIYEALAQHSGRERHRNLERLRELNREHGDEVTLICSHDARMLDDSQAAISLAAGSRS